MLIDIYYTCVISQTLKIRNRAFELIIIHKIYLVSIFLFSENIPNPYI